MATVQSVTMAEYPKEQELHKRMMESLQAYEDGEDVDTLELGLMLNRWFQGLHENELSLDEEIGFLHNFSNCRKNKNHENFIPFKEFVDEGCSCLPTEYQDPAIFQYIKDLGNLTVKLRVGHRSSARPDNLEKFPKICKRMIFTGTGVVYSVKKEKAEDGRRCTCAASTSGGNECAEWFSIEVITVEHVVYDQAEADKTTVELTIFTDDNTEKTFTMSGGKFSVNLDHASCLTFCSHDDELCHLLSSISEGLINSYRSSIFVGRKFLPIVSHPHGMDKHASFGHIVEEDDPAYNCPMVYNTPTCQGSSGASIRPDLQGMHLHECGEGTDNTTNISGGRLVETSVWDLLRIEPYITSQDAKGQDYSNVVVKNSKPLETDRCIALDVCSEVFDASESFDASTCRYTARLEGNYAFYTNLVDCDKWDFSVQLELDDNGCESDPKDIPMNIHGMSLHSGPRCMSYTYRLTQGQTVRVVVRRMTGDCEFVKCQFYAYLLI